MYKLKDTIPTLQANNWFTHTSSHAEFIEEKPKTECSKGEKTQELKTLIIYVSDPRTKYSSTASTVLTRTKKKGLRRLLPCECFEILFRS